MARFQRHPGRGQKRHRLSRVQTALDDQALNRLWAMAAENGYTMSRAAAIFIEIGLNHFDEWQHGRLDEAEKMLRG